MGGRHPAWRPWRRLSHSPTFLRVAYTCAVYASTLAKETEKPNYEISSSHEKTKPIAAIAKVLLSTTPSITQRLALNLLQRPSLQRLALQQLAFYDLLSTTCFPLTPPFLISRRLLQSDTQLFPVHRGWYSLGISLTFSTYLRRASPPSHRVSQGGDG